MKLSKELLGQISKQIVAEYYSAYLYLAMSAYCDSQGYKGFANWMQVQAKEEMAHGTHMFEYLLERGNVPELSEIEAPIQIFDGLEDVFTKSLAHERHISQQIGNIATAAMEEHDHATYIFMQWYVIEQVEEESSAEEVLNKIKLAAENQTAMYSIDAELAKRVYLNPFASSENGR